jgi:hypothetical protein
MNEQDPKVDRWQVCTADKGDDPIINAPDGFEPAGPWFPFAGSATTIDDACDMTTWWRRPLRKVS